ncbi:protein FAM169B isoform X1 [Anabas testudineus]|uniref:protein FAM169B isoform X1 n=1 Tax=Anabas testudineus TaxID=64144 RepID=UPI000E45A0D8|nr:protein FAM169B isoform X1 [Anabas testudineus]XP_026222170.1 protein FAM169B isoform X1 [Anabas testudineus]
MYPVDLPAAEDTDLTSAAEQYISSLESRPHNNKWFELPQASKVAITANNIRHLQLFEDDQPGCAVAALHSPDDPTQVVALYLYDKWWSVDDILRTSNKSRSGLLLVQSIVERVILFLLSQVVERSAQEKVQFSLHPRTESCKLLWRDGQAVGFYTVKHKGSLCDSWSSRCYLLSVLDTMLVRSSWRRRGLGLQMLEDFCSWFSTEEFLGVSSPLSPSMVSVCRRFLQQHEEHRERLYEVEAPGGWTQRRNVWLNIQLGHYLHGSSEQQIKACDPNQGRSSPSSTMSGTRSSPAVHADDLDPGPPARPPQCQTQNKMRNSNPLCTGPHCEGSQRQRGSRDAKRARRLNHVVLVRHEDVV